MAVKLLLVMAAMLMLLAVMLVQPARSSPTPSAEEFGAALVTATNAYAREHDEPWRIGRADCVQATPGKYMCSYASFRAKSAERCHVMQGRWTPRAASKITVTLAGRTERCGSLREALRSLK
jgi:hypothetical protein